MRSTRASAAVARLNARTSEGHYSMARTGGDLFYLTLNSDDAAIQKIGEPLPLDEFVNFVNGLGPQTPKKISRLDIAFEHQLTRKKPD
jgi:hypothetical protein